MPDHHRFLLDHFNILNHMAEVILDKNLDNFLGTALKETGKKAPTIANEIEEDEADEGCTTTQQSSILELLGDLKKDELPAKHVEIISNVKNLKGNEADALIKCFKNAKRRGFSRLMTGRLVETFLIEGVGIRDTSEIDIIKTDETLLEELSESVSYVVDYLGFWKGPLLLLFYGLSSKLKQIINDRKQRTSKDAKRKDDNLSLIHI